MITWPTRIICAVLAISSLTGISIAGPQTPNTNPFLPTAVAGRIDDSSHRHSADTEAIESRLVKDFLGALRVMQDGYFEPWLGQWPRAIDWTAAVIGTHLAGAMSSISRGLSADDEFREKENLIATYFSQLLSYYFGQDSFAIRNEAYDDILWVVLGWLEAVQFIDFHNDLFRQSEPAYDRTMPATDNVVQGISALRNQSWHGNLWVPAFAHRARIFWDIASQGWDTALCGGGMTWNPRLEPYKNAITNELFIAASASMYLYFPGDPYRSPFVEWLDHDRPDSVVDRSDSETPHEAKHLLAALAGYRWLTNSGMRNEQGLFTDGFHISRWNDAGNPNTHCDKRNDMVYTYNQGVLLTGQIGLWKVTGDTRFLRDGHQLIQSVINSTGYDLVADGPLDRLDNLRPGQIPRWRGLGRAGILEEQCDIGGLCSQNSQTFKGIFFHHLTTFCAPLDLEFGSVNETAASASSSEDAETSTPNAPDKQMADFHREACASYVGWIRHNAKAALATRDSDGRFGMWWTAGLLQVNASTANAAPSNPSSGESSVDYRTFGVPDDDTWVPAPAQAHPPVLHEHGSEDQMPLGSGQTERPRTRRQAAAGTRGDGDGSGKGNRSERIVPGSPSDPNSRGRGRTVETQGGGLAVLRCLWEISQAQDSQA